MSVGWGFRGDYGHEAGAMVPGALLALGIVMAGGRRDWWERAAVIADLRNLNPKCSVPTIIIGTEVIIGFDEDAIRKALGIQS